LDNNPGQVVRTVYPIGVMSQFGGFASEVTKSKSKVLCTPGILPEVILTYKDLG